ncbi:MAG: DUF2341 domain-containing protein [Thermoplasmata archaeon]|nr:MAG: DUF2341 domain-containing protein [Thermoplasmata archaeon]
MTFKRNKSKGANESKVSEVRLSDDKYHPHGSLGLIRGGPESDISIADGNDLIIGNDPTSGGPKLKGRGLVNGNGLTNGSGFTNGNGFFRGKGLVNGNGLTNGNRVFRVRGLVNGNGLTNGNGLVNGNGLTNGNRVFRVRGLVNGNGLTNGNGLVNGNGLTNGNAFQKNLHLKNSKRKIMVIRAIMLIIFLTTPYWLTNLPLHSNERNGIFIDGNTSDWKDVTSYEDSHDDQNPEPDVNIVNYRLFFEKEMERGWEAKISFYVEVEGYLFGNPKAEEAGDLTSYAVHIFVDSDRDPKTGYEVKGLGADLVVEIEGHDGVIYTSMLMEFDDSTDNNNWNGYMYRDTVSSAVNKHALEAQILLDPMSVDKVDVLFQVMDSKCNEDFSDTIISNEEGRLIVTQQNIAPEVLDNGVKDVKFLRLNLEAQDVDIEIESINLTLMGTAQMSDIDDISLFIDNRSHNIDENVSIATADFSEEKIEVILDKSILLRNESTTTMFVTVSISHSAVKHRAFGLSIASRKDLVLKSGTVTLHSDLKLVYIGAIPNEVMIDGAFSDWRSVDTIKDFDDSQIKNENVDVDEYKVTGDFQELSFYFKVRGNMMGGTSIPIVPNYYEYTDIPVANPEKDDKENDTTEILPFDKESVPEGLFGEDSFYIFIDSDQNRSTGYRPDWLPLGAEHLIEISGKNGIILGTASWTFNDVLVEDISSSISLEREVVPENRVESFWEVSWRRNNIDIKAQTDSDQLEAKILGGLWGRGSGVGVFFIATNWNNRDIDSEILLVSRASIGTRTGGESLTELINGIGVGEEDGFGWNVSYAGDVNDDGYPDIIVGAPFHDHLDWWDTDWGFRNKLTFDNSDQSEELVSFPILVNLSASNINYSKLKSDGNDLRFIDANGDTELTFHIEDWNVSGYSYIWVNVTNIDAASSLDHIWMYYNNSGASDAQDSSGTYNANYVGVWHLNETSGTHYDATSNDNDGAPYGGLSQDRTGWVDGADEFDGSDDYIDLDLFSLINFTIDFWFKGEGSIIGYENLTLKTSVDLNSESADTTIIGERGGDQSGCAVSSGDVNGDGVNDTIIGAYGRVFIIYGYDRVDPDTHDLNSVFANITIEGDAHESFGLVVAAGDVNNDSYDDVIVGAKLADPTGGEDAGEVYVIYGGDYASGTTIDLNSGSANLTISGDDSEDNCGNAIASGDINNDGYDDVIIGAPTADPAGGDNAGETYVIYGGDWTSGATIDLNSVSANVTIYGNNSFDISGWAVSSGNINNDDYDDVIIGAYNANTPGGNNAGETYVIYGNDYASGTTFDLNSVSANLTIYGDNATDYSGYAVSSGDINNDGFADVIIGAYEADPPGGTGAGVTYVIYGNNYASGTTIDLDSVSANITIFGDDMWDDSGKSVSSGDFNKDDFDDVIIGVPGADRGGTGTVGETYVIYGEDYASGTTIDLNSVPANITIIGDDAQDQSGYAVSSGDINGDGYIDVIIGALYADPTGGDQAGETYVIYGNDSTSGTIIDLDSESANLTVYGDDGKDHLGNAMSSADINGDGFSDMIVGAYYADTPGGIQAGRTYVFYGSNTFTQTIDLSSESADITIYGDDADDQSGYSVSSGDINGDGIDDIIIGAYDADPAGGTSAGETYVIYGTNYASGTIIDLNSVSADLTIYGDDNGDFCGWAVSSGDINNDSYDDVIIGAPYADPSGGNAAGETYVIYGGDWTSGSTIDLNSVSANLTIYGDDFNDLSGSAVSSGDINNDGYDDVIIGAYAAYPNGGDYAGESYVIYGGDWISGSIIDLNTESANITIGGEDPSDQSGTTVSSGDINKDGYDDVIIGAPTASVTGRSWVGITYVIYGDDWASGTLIDLDTMSANITIIGDDASDNFGGSVSSGDVNNDGFEDVIISASGADPVGGDNAGETYVIFGDNYNSGTTIDLGSVAANLTIYGDDKSDRLGNGAICTGDFNNDGYAELMIGAKFVDVDTRYDCGAPYVINPVSSAGIIKVETINSRIRSVFAPNRNSSAVMSSGINNSNWHSVTITKGGDLRLYVNGSLVATSNIQSDSIAEALTFTLGALNQNGTLRNYFDGIIDEIKISSIARSADWVNAQYLSMDNNFVTYGSEQNQSEAQLTDSGAAYIFFGYPGINSSSINASNANVTIYGANAGDLFGWSVSDLGNVNSDTKDDIIIGAPGFGVDKGKAYVFYGRASPSWNDINNAEIGADIKVTGESDGDRFGSSVSGAGDVNSDNYNDVIVGATEYRDLTGIYKAVWGSSDIMVNQNSDTEAQAEPAIAVDSNGDAIFVWHDYRSGNFDIFAQKFDSDGNVLWNSQDVKVNQNSDSASQLNPSIDVDSSGNAIIVWEDSRDSGTNGTEIYAQKLNSTGDPQWGSSDKKVNQNSDTAAQMDPEVAEDSEGNLIVTWLDERNGATNDSIYAQKLNTTGDAQWGSSDVRVNQESSLQNRQSIDVAVDSSGNAIIVWTDFRDDTDIYAQKLNSTGIVQWGSSDKKVNQISDSTSQSSPRIAADSSQNTIIVWEDQRNSGYDIYAQKLNTNGDAQWGSSDMKVNQNSDSASQRFPVVDVDTDGRAIVVWQDGRNSNNDIYAQKLDSSGSTLWGSTDMKVNQNLDTQTQQDPDIAFDSDANAVIVWRDYRNSATTSWDIYTQKLEPPVTGGAFIFHGGSTMDSIADLNISGENDGDKFGFSVSSAGDVDNDGYYDVIIGAPYNDDTGTDAGKAYIYFGGDIYSYVASNITTLGTISDFNNSKSESDSGVYATLTEEWDTGVAESGDVHFLVVQGAPERGSEAWWEWIVVNPTGSSKNCTEVRVKRTDNTDMSWTVGVQGYPTGGWADGGTAGLYWSGSETISAHSAKHFRVRAKSNVGDGGGEMTWSATVTGESVSDVTTTAAAPNGGSWGGMFYNRPNSTTEQTEVGTYPDGLYAYLYEDTNNQPLIPGMEYTFYVNFHEWADKAIAAGGTLTINIPKEFTDVELIDNSDFSDAVVSGGSSSNWTITGTNDAAISNDVQNLSFNATAPLGYNTNSSWQFDTRFTGTGGASETVRYICEANVLVKADSSNYRMSIEFNTTDPRFGDGYYLELNYSVDGSEPNFGLQFYNGASGRWDDLSSQGDLTSTSFTIEEYTLNNNNRLGIGYFRARFIGRNETSDNDESELYIEYFRIKITNAYLPISGEYSDNLFGWSVANLGDINQDGSYDDVVIGSPNYHAEPPERVWGVMDQIVNQNSDTDNQYYPDVAMDSNGNSIVVWQDYRGDGNYIYAQKFDVNGNPLWGSSDVNVSQYSGSGNKYRPAVAIDSNDYAIIVWEDGRIGEGNRNIYAQKLDEDGNPQWDSSDVKVNQNIDSQIQVYPEVAIDSI